MEYCVTVIIPMYNRAHIIGRALESVFRQTLQDIEIIIVDDGSTDTSIEVVQKYQKTHPNIKLYVAQHGGPGLARNVGIEHASGEYIVFLDSDDWIPDTGYEMLYQLAKERDADIVVGQYMRKINGGKWMPSTPVSELLKEIGTENCAGKYIVPVKNPSCWNKMIRRELLQKNNIRFLDAHMAEDLMFSVTLFDVAEKVFLMDYPVYMYETDSTQQGSIITTPSPDIIDSGIRMMKEIGLKFHNCGDVEAQVLNLEGSFQFILNRFWTMPDSPKKYEIFEHIKEYVAMFHGLTEYRMILEDIFRIDIDIMLKYPYQTYIRESKRWQKRNIMSAPLAMSKQQPAAPVVNPQLRVLQMYENGQLGFVFIWKYFKAWLKFKLKRWK